MVLGAASPAWYGNCNGQNDAGGLPMEKRTHAELLKEYLDEFSDSDAPSPRVSWSRWVTRRLGAPLAVGTSLLVGACGGSSDSDDGTNGGVAGIEEGQGGAQQNQAGNAGDSNEPTAGTAGRDEGWGGYPGFGGTLYGVFILGAPDTGRCAQCRGHRGARRRPECRRP